ncbi:MAG: alpha-ketoacid dehydrogenase subunit beta [Kiritimatiellota bacterium]|nr:alpha-ketoacid dehydrogenase subunit beta [Kiritimatiellota bacterium]
MREIFYNQALGEALAEEMRRDKNVVLWGIDIGPYGGANGVTKGLFDEFGAERIIDMPIAELGYVGLGVGAAATGIRPVIELQFSDWITLPSEMIINQAAKMRYMFGGVLEMPLVIRAPIGAYLSAGAQHSNSFESLFSFVPGIKVVTPATPYDAKGLLKSAIRDNNTVLFFEHKKLYGVKGPVPEEEYTIPMGEAAIVREGTDVTIVTYAYMVSFCLKAAEKLAAQSVNVEIIDLRTVDPLDEKKILVSIQKTHRLVVVQETWRECSVSSEVAAIAAEKALYYLDAPVIRVTSEDVPMPFSPVLEQRVLPSVEKIVDAVNRVMEREPA